MPLPWLQSFVANKPELRVSAIIATVATVTVISSGVWSLFFSYNEEPQLLIKGPTAVEITQKPVANNPPEKPRQVLQVKKITPKQKVSSIEKTTQQVTIGKGKLYVQVGAFKQSKSAHLLLKKMKRKYKRAEIMTKSDLYLVWVGPVATRSEASRLIKNIQRHEKIKGFTVSKK